mmetsp:Transcript_925/g.2612  ORF Transcript_925/g.2612 Transcript_925/m.2612 type:complete len:287 (-) Transcript_925:179-1039(-)
MPPPGPRHQRLRPGGEVPRVPPPHLRADHGPHAGQAVHHPRPRVHRHCAGRPLNAAGPQQHRQAARRLRHRGPTSGHEVQSSRLLQPRRRRRGQRRRRRVQPAAGPDRPRPPASDSSAHGDHGPPRRVRRQVQLGLPPGGLQSRLAALPARRVREVPPPTRGGGVPHGRVPPAAAAPPGPDDDARAREELRGGPDERGSRAVRLSPRARRHGRLAGRRLALRGPARGPPPRRVPPQLQLLQGGARGGRSHPCPAAHGGRQELRDAQVPDQRRKDPGADRRALREVC